MTSGRSGLIDVCGELRVDRPDLKAVLFFDGAREAWLPRSLVEIEATGPGALVTVTLPEWLAYETELI